MTAVSRARPSAAATEGAPLIAGRQEPCGDYLPLAG